MSPSKAGDTTYTDRCIPTGGGTRYGATAGGPHRFVARDIAKIKAFNVLCKYVDRL